MQPEYGSAVDGTFGPFWARVTACHVVTYFVAGVLAYTLFDYRALFETEPLSSFMRPTSSKWVAAGAALQVIRGLIFAVALYPFRRIFLDGPRGWLRLWGLFLGLAILSPAGPSPASVEGLIYTKIPISSHLQSLPEVGLQTLVFSVLLVAWYRHPQRSWSIVMGTMTVLVILMSLAGVFLERPESFQ